MTDDKIVFSLLEKSSDSSFLREMIGFAAERPMQLETGAVQADFQMLEQAVKTGPEFAKLFGITTVNKASSNAADYPYILSEVAELIAGKGAYWHTAQVCIDRISSEKKVDIKASDNQYHCATKTGRGKKQSPTNIQIHSSISAS